MNCDLPYVDSFRDRYGRPHFYFRRKGRRIKLPGVPGSPEFLRAYQTALEANDRAQPSVSVKAGTFDALRLLYLASAEFKNLRPSTQRETRYVIDAVAQRPNKTGGKNGDNSVASLERKTILKWRDEMADRPGAANKMLGVLKLLLSFAVDRDFRKDNPAKGIKPLKLGRFRSWTDEELDAFEDKWSLGTLERTGYALALYTGQRRADVAALKWSAIAGNGIRVRQSKTGTDLTIAIHPQLREALAAVHPRRGETVLTGQRGAALNPIYFGHLMAAAIEEAGLPTDCVLHGLRKTTARIVAETGGKVGSMTGHLSAAMEQEYSRGADQKRMSKAAVLKWSRAGRNRAKNK